MSGSSLLLFAEEFDAICGLPHAQQLLYLAIRYRMDGRSFIAGEPARLSDQYLRERVEVTAERGRREAQLFKATRHQLRWLIDALVSRGLLQRIQGCELVFRLPVAAAASSVRRTSAQFPRASSARGADGRNASAGAGFDGVGEDVSAHDDAGISAPPQCSVNSFSVVEPEGEVEVTRVAPTVAGALCRRLRALGVGKLSTAHPRFLQALAMGITTEEFEDCVRKRVQAGHDPPSLPWLAEAVIGKRQDRQRQQAHGTASGGAGQKQSSSERAEAALRHGNALARERVAGRLRVIPGGRAPAGDPAGAVDPDGWDLSTPLDLGPGRHA